MTNSIYTIGTVTHRKGLLSGNATEYTTRVILKDGKYWGSAEPTADLTEQDIQDLLVQLNQGVDFWA